MFSNRVWMRGILSAALLLSCLAQCVPFSIGEFIPRIQTPAETTLFPRGGRRLLQVTTDSISFSVVFAASDTNATQTAMTNANSIIEGFASSTPTVHIPASCPANSISPAGSISVSQCYCLPGYMGNAFNGSSCTPCPVDTFCIDGTLSLCPTNAHTPAASDSILDCNCEPGYFRTNVYQCVTCPAGSRCSNNLLSTCPSGSYSNPGSSECTPCPLGTFQASTGSPECPACPGGLTVLKTTEFNELFSPSDNRSTVPEGEDKVYILRGYLTQSQDKYLTKWSFFADKAGCTVTPLIFGATVLGNAWEVNVQFDVRHVGTTRTTTSAGLQTFRYSDAGSYYVRTAVPTNTPYLNQYEFFAWAFTGPSCIPYDLADMHTHYYWMEFPAASDLSTSSHVFIEAVHSAPRFWSVQITYEHRAMIPSTVSTGTRAIMDCKCPSTSRQMSDGNCQGLCEDGKYMLRDTDEACTLCPQGSKCSKSVVTPCQSEYSSLPGSTICSPCPGPGTHTNIALHMCGLLKTCTAATPARLGTSVWYGLGAIHIGSGGIGNFPSTPWFPGSQVAGMVLNAAADMPYALLQRTVIVSSGMPIALQFRCMCTGFSCSASISVQWSQNNEPYTTVFATQSIPSSTMASPSWVQSSTDFITPNASQIRVRIVAEMMTSSSTVWLSMFEAVSLGQWVYSDISRLRLLDTVNVQVPHFTDYSEDVESSTLKLTDTSFSQSIGPVGVFEGYPYMVSVWAYGTGTLTLGSSEIDTQTWTTSSALTQYLVRTTESPALININITGTVVISSPSVSLRTLDIGCQQCLANHWCSTQQVFDCPQNSLSVEGAPSQSNCYCKAGYYGRVTSTVGWTPCSLCDTNFFCTGGNHRKACPDGSKSDPGSVQCTPCGPGEICKAGMIGSCPLHSHGPPNASDVSDCVCDDGYYGNAPDCMQCEPGSYCSGGEAYACTEFATSTPRAVNTSECFCERGYYGLANTPCTACEEGSWCWTGVKNQCPAHTWSPSKSSFPGNCTCEYGYYRSGASCIPCSAGSYKTSRGFSECTLCKAGTFSPITAATSPSACADCDIGYFTATLGQFQCQPCSAGYYTPLLGSVDCKPCWIGSYSLGGAATCTGCSAGSMSSAVAAQSSSVCTACPVGSWSPGNTSRCAICGACTYWNYPRKFSFIVNSLTPVMDLADQRIRFAVHPLTSLVYMSAGTKVFTVDLTAKNTTQEIAIQGPGRVWWFSCLAASQLGNFLYAIQSTYVFRVDLEMGSWDLVYPSSSATCVVEDVTRPESPLIWIAQIDGVRSMHPEQALVVNSHAITGSNYICLNPVDRDHLYVTGSFGLKKVRKDTGAQKDLLTGTAYTVCRFTPEGSFLIMANAASKTAWAYSLFDGSLTRILNNAAVSGILTESTNLVFGIDTVGVRNVSYDEKDSDTCSPGKYSQYSGLQLESQCNACPVGSLCPGGSNITQCVPGTYSLITGLREQRQCTPCPPGYYCTGGSALQMCPLGSYSLLSAVSAVADCAQCRSGFFCPNTTGQVQCPANTMSSAGASDLGECLCAPGYRCIMVLVVHAEILLPIVRNEFTHEIQARYIAAIALAAGVSIDKVRIISISDVIMGAGRRLLGFHANAVEVHTNIYDSHNAGVTDLNTYLQRNGLPTHRGIRVSIHKEVVNSFKLTSLDVGPSPPDSVFSGHAFRFLLCTTALVAALFVCFR